MADSSKLLKKLETRSEKLKVLLTQVEKEHRRRNLKKQFKRIGRRLTILKKQSLRSEKEEKASSSEA
jgi:hypothetical protein